MILLKAENLTKTYDGKEIFNVDLEIKKGEFVVITGKSGEGKTTLLNVLSTIDSENVKGKLTFFGKHQMLGVNDFKKTKFRGKNIGYVFQSYELIPEFDVIENVIVPVLINKTATKKEAVKKAEKLLNEVGIDKEHFNKKPHQLSGGQQQRVAIARAVINSPKILFADEPTGNLDEESSKYVVEIFKNIRKNGTTIVLVTHNVETFESVNDKRILKLKEKRLTEIL